MVKRVVDTAFWTDMQVIDNYSVEDKYFLLYLMTNDKTTQVGIYPLPIKVISFETGYTTDVINVLIERFSNKYKKIIYSEQTQEVTILQSLQYSILKGGKPVSDLLEKELNNVKDERLILETYDAMESFWNLSKRKYDQTIKELFEMELHNRGLIQYQNENQKENDNHNEMINDNGNDNQKQNDNHNEESWATNRGTNRADADETALLDRYANYLKENNPQLQEVVTPENIVTVYYRHTVGEVHPHIANQLKKWQESNPKSLILEALSRSLKANHPLAYAESILENWANSGVKSYKDVVKLDSEYNREKY